MSESSGSSTAVLWTYWKPRPWFKKEEVHIDKDEKKKNLREIVRKLTLNSVATPVKIRRNDTIKVKSFGSRRRNDCVIRIPCLIRNKINGVRAYSCYKRKVIQWIQMQPMPLNEKENESPLHRKSRGEKRDFFNLNPTNDVSDSKVEDMSSMSSVDFSNLSQLSAQRSFYTVWHIGKLERRPGKTRDDVAKNLNSLAYSDSVNRAIERAPKGAACLFDNGHPVPIDATKRSSLPTKTKLCLDRWSRISHYTSDWTAGDQSGEEEDSVDYWNSKMTSDSSSCQEMVPECSYSAGEKEQNSQQPLFTITNSSEQRKRKSSDTSPLNMSLNEACFSENRRSPRFINTTR